MHSEKNYSHIKWLVMIGELLIINASFLLAYWLNKTHLSSDFFLHDKHVYIYLNVAYLWSFSVWGIVFHRRNVRMEEILDRVSKILLTQFLMLFVVVVFTEKLHEFTFRYVITLFLLEFLFIVGYRRALSKIIKLIRQRRSNIHNVIVLGTGNMAVAVQEQIIGNAYNSYRLKGFFDNREHKNIVVEKSLLLGKLDDVLPYLQANKIDEIFCALPAGDDRRALPILDYAEKSFITFYFVPDFSRFLTRKVNLQFVDDLPLISLRSEPLESYVARFIKRTFDVVVSFLFLLLLFPLLFLIFGSLIKLSSKGDIFFKQKRTGKKGKSFVCYKFRSMKQNIESDEKQATRGDERVTGIGAFLRHSNLDELPQFWNVLKGDMSIIGPRPHMLNHTEQYSKLIDKYMLRHWAKPGITGWAQVNGYRGETRNLSEMKIRVEYDVWYLENWTFWLDIKIIFKTIILMIKGDKNAY
ncbi:MAG: undecaprenyl-phosphate glucose phosphotransferase [Prevotellaceae bacterium]|jgi:putative colanic acid biosynthesis UDP-glucose lipid carrier transferase|nr:undecaprenyl-phosphate glucose phosphotransferase [Prevotellaceae bacterium]